MTPISLPISRLRRNEVKLPAIENGDCLNQATFHARYKTMPSAFRAELIGGRVHAPSPLRLAHSELHVELVFWLKSYARKTPGVRVTDHATTILGPDSEPQPDAALLIEGGQTRKNAEGYMVGPPELVVEVASSSRAYDLFDKRHDYERYGVAEYLVLLLDEERAVWFTRPARRKTGRTGKFVEAATPRDGLCKSAVAPGLWLDPAALFRLDTNKVMETLNVGLATAEHAAFVARLR